MGELKASSLRLDTQMVEFLIYRKFYLWVDKAEIAFWSRETSFTQSVGEGRNQILYFLILDRVVTCCKL